MLNNILGLFGSNLEAGLFTFVLGMLIVFGGMAIIVLVVTVIGKIMVAVKKKPADKKPEQKAIEGGAPAAPAPAAVDEVTDEVIAVITAAVAAILSEEKPHAEFVVKKIKKL